MLCEVFFSGILQHDGLAMAKRVARVWDGSWGSVKVVTLLIMFPITGVVQHHLKIA